MKLLRRAVAAITALLIASATVIVVAAPAAATPALWIGGSTAPAAPHASDPVTLNLDLQGTPDVPCTLGNAPTVTWEDGAGASGTLPAPGTDGVSLRYSAVLGTFPVGTTTITATATGGCAQPYDDDTPPSVQTYTVTVTADPVPDPWPPANDSRTISGTVWQVFDDVATPLVGATVLLASDVGGVSEYYSPTTTTDELGRYSVSLHGDVGAPLVTVAVLLPNLPAVFYVTGASATSGSPQDQSAATPLNSENWDVSALYDVYYDFGDTPVESDPLTISGTVQQIWDDVATPLSGATVDLYDAGSAGSGEPLGTTTTDGDGHYSVSLPGDVGSPDVTLAVHPYDIPSVFYLEGATEASGSPESEASATVLDSATWDTSAAYDIFVDYDSGTSHTDPRLECGDGNSYDLGTSRMTWSGVCQTEMLVGGVTTTAGRTALADFGRVWLDLGRPSPYYARADVIEDDTRYSTTQTYLRVIDRDVRISDTESVDIHMIRSLVESGVTWYIWITPAGSEGSLVYVPFTFGGDLATGGQTQWHDYYGLGAVSTDDGPFGGDGDAPILLHSLGDFEQFDAPGDGEDFVAYPASGGFRYILMAADYTGCDAAGDDSMIDYATQVAASMMGPYSIEPFTGAACPELGAGWDEIATQNLVSMTGYDQTFAPDADPGWDWSTGGTIEVIGDLPPYLQSEVLDAGQPGVAPSVRIHGTPVGDATATVTLRATDSDGNIRDVSVDYVVAQHTCTVPDDYVDRVAGSVQWNGLCLWDASIADARMANTRTADGAVGAFDGIGIVTVNGHRIWADSGVYEDDGRWEAYDQDVDAGEDRLVDVRVERYMAGSTALWAVQVLDPETGEQVDATISITGTVGTDGDPSWFVDGGHAISADLPGTGRPILAHSTTGTFTHAVSGDAGFEVQGDGFLIYLVAMVDYPDCAYFQTVAQAAQLLASGLGTPSSEIYTAPGEECVAVWEQPEFDVTVGDEVDVTIRPPSDGPMSGFFALSSALTADLADLPPGLQAEVVDEATAGVTPGLHVWGVPTTEGDYDIPLTLVNNVTVATTATFHVGAAVVPEQGGWDPIPTQHLTAGVTEYDESFSPTGSDWDWVLSADITVDGLPLGLAAVASQPGGVGTPPRVRITGTPLRDGPATVRLSGIDSTGAIRYIDVEFEVAAPECTEIYHYSDLSFHDTATRWLGLCRYDATLRDALGRHTSRAADAVGAFAGLGEITVGGSRVWAEDLRETFDDNGQFWNFTDYDVDAGEAGLVDVVVERHINGSTAAWFVNAYVAGTNFGQVADADIVISGTVGSNGSTAWFTAGPTSVISVDAPGSQRPIVVHGTNGAFAHGIDGDAAFSVSGSGSLSYTAAIVDFDGCSYRDTVAFVSSNVDYFLHFGNMGVEYTFDGEECVPIWDGTDVVARVGDTIDVTVRATADGPFWDFALGGTSTADFSDVTGGLNAELVDQGASGVGPGVRIWGTVTAEGEFGIPITASDGVVTSGVTAWVHLLPALAGDEDPEKTMSIDLEAEIGDIVAGTDVTVTGTGLADPSTWDLVVHSTPQLIGSGSASAGGTIAATATIPAGLEAGWHSLTFAGTWFDSSAASAVLWFQLDSAGRLIGTSSTAPATAPAADAVAGAAGNALGATGAIHDGSDGRLGLLLLVAGLAALVIARQRLRRVSRLI